VAARDTSPPNSAAPAPAQRAQAIDGGAAKTVAAKVVAAKAGAAKAVAAKAGACGTALLAALEARIDEAVREAASMPQAARRQHREGRTRVRFTYLDGIVSGVELVSPSQSRVLDDAALQAVRCAAYPLPPEALRGRHLDLQVWVNFRLDA